MKHFEGLGKKRRLQREEEESSVAECRVVPSLDKLGCLSLIFLPHGVNLAMFECMKSKTYSVGQASN